MSSELSEEDAEISSLWQFNVSTTGAKRRVFTHTREVKSTIVFTHTREVKSTIVFTHTREVKSTIVVVPISCVCLLVHSPQTHEVSLSLSLSLSLFLSLSLTHTHTHTHRGTPTVATCSCGVDFCFQFQHTEISAVGERHLTCRPQASTFYWVCARQLPQASCRHFVPR